MSVEGRPMELAYARPILRLRYAYGTRLYFRLVSVGTFPARDCFELTVSIPFWQGDGKELARCRHGLGKLMAYSSHTQTDLGVWLHYAITMRTLCEVREKGIARRRDSSVGSR